MGAGARADTAVIDRHGLTVSATPSVGGLQSYPTVEALGFCLSI